VYFHTLLFSHHFQFSVNLHTESYCNIYSITKDTNGPANSLSSYSNLVTEIMQHIWR